MNFKKKTKREVGIENVKNTMKEVELKGLKCDEKVVKESVLLLDASMFTVKVIKKKFLDQIDYFTEKSMLSKKLDLDWLVVFGWFNDNPSGMKTWKMVLFQYKKKYYKLDIDTFRFYSENPSNLDKIPQIFVD
jgi:hypothetical protein